MATFQGNRIALSPAESLEIKERKKTCGLSSPQIDLRPSIAPTRAWEVKKRAYLNKSSPKPPFAIVPACGKLIPNLSNFQYATFFFAAKQVQYELHPAAQPHSPDKTFRSEQRCDTTNQEGCAFTYQEETSAFPAGQHILDCPAAAGSMMARKSNPQALRLEQVGDIDYHDLIDSPSPRSPPLSSRSPKSPRIPFSFPSKRSRSQGGNLALQIPDVEQPSQAEASQAAATAVASASAAQEQLRPSTSAQEKTDPERPARTGFFSNYKNSKSSSRLHTERKNTEQNMSRDNDPPQLSSSIILQESKRHESGNDKGVQRKPVPGPSASSASLSSSVERPQTSSATSSSKKGKPKPFSILSRTRSMRGDEQSPADLPPPTTRTLEPSPDRAETFGPLKSAPKTAPLQSHNERSFREMMGPNVRQHSADRQTSKRDMSAGREQHIREHKDSSRQQSLLSSSFRDSTGHTFLNNLKSSATKGAGALSKGLFSKVGRSSGANEKEPLVDDEHYQLKVINLPLIEQTRRTRISKRLEHSRDKTEFWMPAFPWRAIDYLNYKGSDVEGLYRVPGSGPQIKKWQRRFDEELDIDLFEQDDLYDINIIGSMLKAWLRELPDELFPKAAQDRVARECVGSEKVPQMLIDELSSLPPFNYYLLFAITCHLSLLLAHSEKNKMDYRNLCICFQPCMRIDAFCFKFLVCDWRECWKGCKTEPYWIDQEYQIFNEISPASIERSGTSAESHESNDNPEERNISSSDSSKPSSGSIDQHDSKGDREGQFSDGGRAGSMDTISTASTVMQDHTPPRQTEMRPLSPIKPLSPIGF
ncbi:hypothetical protein B7463_g10177, partial [Scytalidium lignicola]